MRAMSVDGINIRVIVLSLSITESITVVVGELGVLVIASGIFFSRGRPEYPLDERRMPHRVGRRFLFSGF